MLQEYQTGKKNTRYVCEKGPGYGYAHLITIAPSEMKLGDILKSQSSLRTTSLQILVVYEATNQRGRRWSSWVFYTIFLMERVPR